MISSKGNSKRGRPKKKNSEDGESSDEFVKKKVLQIIFSYQKRHRKPLLSPRRRPKPIKRKEKRRRPKAKSKFQRALTVMNQIALKKRKKTYLRS
jgi:hypothetical protein